MDLATLSVTWRCRGNVKMPSTPGMPVDVLGAGVAGQEPSVAFKPSLDAGPVGLHGQYLHVETGFAMSEPRSGVRHYCSRAWQCKPPALIYFGGLRPQDPPLGRRSACRCTGALKRVLPDATPHLAGPEVDSPNKICRTPAAFVVLVGPVRGFR